MGRKTHFSRRREQFQERRVNTKQATYLLDRQAKLTAQLQPRRSSLPSLDLAQMREDLTVQQPQRRRFHTYSHHLSFSLWRSSNVKCLFLMLLLLNVPTMVVARKDSSESQDSALSADRVTLGKPVDPGSAVTQVTADLISEFKERLEYDEFNTEITLIPNPIVVQYLEDWARTFGGLKLNAFRERMRDSLLEPITASAFSSPAILEEIAFFTRCYELRNKIGHDFGESHKDIYYDDVQEATALQPYKELPLILRVQENFRQGLLTLRREQYQVPSCASSSNAPAPQCKS